MVLFLPLLYPYIRIWETRQERRLKEEFQIQFRDYLQALASALSTGYALENAMKEARKDLGQQYDCSVRIMKDTKMMEHLLEMNMPVEQIWQEWSTQVQMEVMTQFVTVFIVAKRSGGDSITLIKNAIGTICETLEVENEIRVILAGKRMEFYIMSFVPLGILAYMKLCFTEFMSVLYGNTFGIILMTVCLGVYGVAIMWGNRILQIEV